MHNVVAAALALTAGNLDFSKIIPRNKYRGDCCITCGTKLPPGRCGRECPKCRGIEVEGEHLDLQKTE